ncbi:MAG: SufB/SufD family protein [Candidatus Micrarchaeia archaeon]
MDLYSKIADEALQKYRILEEESKDILELHKRNYIPIPGDFDNIEEHEHIDEHTLVKGLEENGLRFSAIVGNDISKESKNIKIRKPEDLGEKELAALGLEDIESIEDKYLAYVVSKLDKIVLVDAHEDAQESMLIMGSRLNVAILANTGKKVSLRISGLVMTTSKRAEIGIYSNMHADEHSDLGIDIVHNEGAGANVLSFSKGSAELGASISFNSAYFGGDITRSRNRISATAPTSSVSLNDVTIATNKQKVDILNFITNIAGKTKSESHSRVIAFDRSMCIVKGFAKIGKGSSESSSYIEQKGISVGKGAQVQALPEMAIEESNVKAKHSASVVPINDDVLFYITSRGVPYESSRRLLLISFASQLINKFGSDFAKIIAYSILQKKIMGDIEPMPSAGIEFNSVLKSTNGLVME